MRKADMWSHSPESGYQSIAQKTTYIPSHHLLECDKGYITLVLLGSERRECMKMAI